ncbi:cell division protein ZapB [Desulfobulbus alkaliphilus]|uniref:cell division protein ZapB n=1 Tax=Desulfobulbus alkaliphilus TaxID=869814 RepID=UPI001962BB1E|nr:cell division protein ZapB [Desulfobulbus alkaliphilus]MBM9537336.1 cell division protein ZapB [Desulfobulbus alkaliphilus]
MGNNSELVRLEEFVDKLLTKYNQLKSEYLSLRDTLAERDAECADLKNSISNLSNERSEVGSRVAGLVDRIEQWENEQVPLSQEPVEQHGGPQGSLFGGDAGNKE